MPDGSPIQVDMGFRPHSGHAKLFASTSRFTIVVAHRRFGKTIGAIALLVHCAMAAPAAGEGRPAAQFAYIAPYLKQARRIAWRYLKQFSTVLDNVRVLEGENIIRFGHNGAEIHLYGADNADAMRGMYFMGVVADELADWGADVLPLVVMPTLADHQGWLLIIGTPKGENLLAELWRDWQKRDDAACLMFRADESGVLPADELELQRSILTDRQFRQEFLCDFDASAEDILLTIDHVVKAQARLVLNEEQTRGLVRIIGVDVARYGDDRSCIARRIGPWWQPPIVLEDIDNMALAARVAAEAAKFKADAIFVDAGRGEGVIDRLRMLGHQAIEVNFGGRPDDPTYANKRAEMWDLMAQHVEAEAILPKGEDGEALLRDLVAPTYKFRNGDGRFALEGKEDMKKRVGRSPDVGDAYAVTYAAPVVPKSWRNTSTQAESEFDPMEGV